MGDEKQPVQKQAHNCKWASPTIDEPSPEWTAAADTPWTCRRDAVAVHLESTERCEDCPRWEETPEPERGGSKPEL